MAWSSLTATGRTLSRRIPTWVLPIPPIGEFLAPRTRPSMLSTPKRAKSFGRAEIRSLRGTTGAASRLPTVASTLGLSMETCIVSVFRSSLLLLLGFGLSGQDSSADRIQSLERELKQQQRASKDWGGLVRYGSDKSELPAPAKGESRVIFLG